MSTFVDLIALLESRARELPDGTYLIHESERYSYAQVLAHARRYRAALLRRGVTRGSYVLLLLDNGPRFFAALFGAQMCGAIPVPLSPKSPAERVDYILSDSGAAHVLIDDDFPVDRGGVASLSARARLLAIPCGELEADGAPVDASSSVSRTAFVQYTSGSTGEAKGVVISHRAVLANIRGFAPGLAVDPARDVFSSMMPMFHDMGLVCFGLGSLYMRAPLAIYRQEALSLYHWLEGFARYRVTISGGPNLFLHLANRVVRDPSRYDLSSMRAFVCGSEPIALGAVRAFEERYGVPNVVKPAYGMAEISLCATMTRPDEPYRVHDERTISCGRALPGVDIVILAGDEMTRAPRVTGEILIRTPALMDGYLHRPEQSERALRDGYYQSGDLGFFDPEGVLYVTGRKKNLIIRGGEKFAPGELEAVATLEREVAQCAVVGLDDAETALQSIVLVAEVDRDVRGKPEALRAIARRICDSARARIGWGPEVLVFAPRGRIPTTLNGKVQHSALKALLEANAFASDANIRSADLRA